MRKFAGRRLALCCAAAAVFACCQTQYAAAQNARNPNLPLHFGKATLNSEFHPSQLLACFRTLRSAAQDFKPDPSLPSNFGKVDLEAGFANDPFVKELVAGGGNETVIAGVKMKITKAPDFKLYYKKGGFPLSFYVRSQADTTLLINLPDNSYVANDDGGGNLNPLITLKTPMSGRYDIWVGVYQGGNAKANLYITELNVNTPIPKL